MTRNSAIARTSAIAALAMVAAGAWLLAGMLAIPLISQGLAIPLSMPGADHVTPITDPTQLPRLSFENLRYAGAFRLPHGEANGDTFASGGGPIAYDAERNSLYVGSRKGNVAEVTIPTPVNAAEVAALPTAEYLQPFDDPAEGRMKEVAATGAGLAGLLVYRDRLYGTGLIYYDATNAQTNSHFSRPRSLSAKGAGPMRPLWKKGQAGFVAGYLALVPPEWQSRLRGAAVTGQCCVPIISRTSYGPAAFAWDPSALDDRGDLEAVPLVYYPSDHATLGPWSGSGESFGGTTQVNGVALINGTRTALFVGRNGTGPYCYGQGTSDRSLDQTTAKDGTRYCYDPASADKGTHAYPYRYQIWAYDLSEWSEVAAGRRDPWAVKPYAVWPIDLPIAEPSARVGGVAFDPARKRLFISQRAAERDEYSWRPLIHVFHIP